MFRLIGRSALTRQAHVLIQSRVVNHLQTTTRLFLGRRAIFHQSFVRGNTVEERVHEIGCMTALC
jgi:hypothetical protein